ncbi:MAG TPA: hypothetical protein VNZ45_15265 [Bacteroidia bacterium]|jgi:hypothetical protein|nr:hypothetical protein [Bacteroidia bacterium]
MKKLILSAAISFISVTGAVAQNNGIITAYCFNQADKQSIDSVKLELFRNDSLLKSAVSDIYGGHDFKKLPAGNYSIKYSKEGWGSGATTVALQAGANPTANIGMVKRSAKAGAKKK